MYKVRYNKVDLLYLKITEKESLVQHTSWTPEMVDKLIAFRRGEHLEWNEIGKRLELSPEACRCKYKSLREEYFSPNGKMETDFQDNYANVTFTSSRITSLEEIIEACKIDLDVWEIERHVVNTWEMGRKDKKVHMQFDEGKISGEIDDDGEITVETLYQVKVWLVRKEPIALTPVVQPVHISITEYSPKFFNPTKVKRALIFADSQFGFTKELYKNELTPFHDRQAILSLLRVSEEVNPDVIVYLGDIVDFSEWSDKFVRSPEFYWMTQPAIIEAAWWLGKFTQTQPQSHEAYMLEANHELRVKTHLVNHASAAYGLKAANELDAPDLMSVERLLGLSQMGIQYVQNYPNNYVQLNNNLRVIHGNIAKSQPQATARSLVERSAYSVIFGHIHKREMASKTIFYENKTRTVSSYCPGCLCDITGKIAWASAEEQWQQGAFIVDLYENDQFVVNPVIIENGNAYYNGKVYSGKTNIVPQLIADTGWDFKSNSRKV